MKRFFLLFLLCHVSSPVKNTLKISYTVSSGLTIHPEFLGSIHVNPVQAVSCAGYITEETPDVWKQLLKEKLELYNYYTDICLYGAPNRFRRRLERFMQHFNQSGGIHILQAVEGCEWDENTEEVSGFYNYSYDGEDFMSLDLKMQRWITLNPEADVITQEWDADKPRIQRNNLFLTEVCPYWLKVFLDYGRSFLLRTVRPSVCLLQTSPSSPVSCHATGFYPDRATMLWRKDGEDLHEDVDHGEMLPNHDGTFQMRVDLKLSSVKPEDWTRYDCVFHFDGADDIITKLDKHLIRTNEGSSEVPVGLIIAVVGLILLLAVCITGFFIWRRKNNKQQQGFTPARRKQSGEDEDDDDDEK